MSASSKNLVHVVKESSNVLGGEDILLLCEIAIDKIYIIRKRYLRLWGTVLYVYKTKSESIDNRTPPLLTVSMQRVDAGMATEFKRRPRVLRLWIPNGEQFLLRVNNSKDMVSWIEHLQAASNISMDLDHRRMPRFVTMIRPNNNSSGHTYNLDLGDEQRTVVSICRSRCWIKISHIIKEKKECVKSTPRGISRRLTSFRLPRVARRLTAFPLTCQIPALLFPLNTHSSSWQKQQSQHQHQHHLKPEPFKTKISLPRFD